ncbi:MAG: vitamin K epoxide reductase family protein [Pyrinomonadaceae bacterium]|nr:vitamin K epoxide reductase family protein [Pyrinomonadaceae bacterium]MBP6213721.1 vitamin K epoxide reductase family protein [Pyrinomonadaceae bacterium]
MNENGSVTSTGAMKWLPATAAILALVGIVDSVYLTAHHYTAEPVPCSLIEGCEMVLTSSYAEIAGVPLAMFGAAAYFLAFSLALLTAFGNRAMWKFFGAQTVVMAAFSGWLIYVQAAVIGAFCQFCLLSALTSCLLFVIYIISLVTGRKSSAPSAD